MGKHVRWLRLTDALTGVLGPWGKGGGGTRHVSLLGRTRLQTSSYRSLFIFGDRVGASRRGKSLGGKAWLIFVFIRWATAYLSGGGHRREDHLRWDLVQGGEGGVRMGKRSWTGGVGGSRPTLYCEGLLPSVCGEALAVGLALVMSRRNVSVGQWGGLGHRQRVRVLRGTHERGTPAEEGDVWGGGRD